MKKNVTKILLLLVIAMLACALVACNGLGGGGTGGGNKPGKTDKPDKPDKPDNPDKPDTPEVSIVDAVYGITDSVDNLIGSIGDVNKDSELGLELGIKGSYHTKAEATGGFGLSVLANATQNGPEAKLGFSLTNKTGTTEYFSIGYNDGFAYLKQPLNFINTTDTKPESVKMSVKALENSINELTKYGIGKIEDLANYTFKIKDTEYVLKDFKVTDFVKSLGDSTISMLDGVANIQVKENETVLSISASGILGLLPMMGINLNLSEYAPTIDNFCKENNITFAKLGADDDSLVTYDAILGNDATYPIMLNVGIGYKDMEIGGKSKKVLNSIGLGVSLVHELRDGDGNVKETEELFNAKLDIVLDIATKANKAIDLSGEEKDLKASVGIDLGVKGLDARLDVLVNTSDAFAQDGNMVAEARIVNNKDDSVLAVGGYDGTTVFVDFSKVYELLGANDGNKVAKYKFTQEKSVIASINEFITGIYTPTPNTDNASNVTVDGAIEALKGKGIMDMITIAKDWFNPYDLYELAVSALAKLDLVDANTKVPSTLTKDSKFDVTAGNEFTKLAVTAFGKYTFLGDTKVNTWAEFVAKLAKNYEDNKQLLLDACNTTENSAGVQVTSTGDRASLKAFLLKFLDGNKIYNKVVDEYNKTVTDENKKWAHLAENEEAVDKLIELLDNWVTGLLENYQAGNGAHKDIFTTDFVQKISGGLTISDMLKDLYLEAGKGTGLEGYVLAKASKDATENYIKISGSIGFVKGESYVTMPEDVAGYADFAIKDETTGLWSMNTALTEALWDLAAKALAYTKTK